jgi:hypothetical protein
MKNYINSIFALSLFVLITLFSSCSLFSKDARLERQSNKVIREFILPHYPFDLESQPFNTFVYPDLIHGDTFLTKIWTEVPDSLMIGCITSYDTVRNLALKLPKWSVPKYFKYYDGDTMKAYWPWVTIIAFSPLIKTKIPDVYMVKRLVYLTHGNELGGLYAARDSVFFNKEPYEYNQNCFLDVHYLFFRKKGTRFEFLYFYSAPETGSGQLEISLTYKRGMGGKATALRGINPYTGTKFSENYLNENYERDIDSIEVAFVRKGRNAMQKFADYRKRKAQPNH